jgi:hypothetical protein
MALELARIRRLEAGRRIALIFTVVITLLVFLHNQPWPYVFIMAQPFMALWSTVLFERLAADRRSLRLAWGLLAAAVAVSFARNVSVLRIDNRAQLAVVARAEALLPPGQVYFDGVGMLPNRPEPSTLWLDKTYVLKTLDEGTSSEAYRIFAETPPKMIIWSYRMDAIKRVVDPLIRDSYVQVAPNIRLAGRRLRLGQPVAFVVPVAGTYALYSESGEPLNGAIEIGNALVRSPVRLRRGCTVVTLRSGAEEALLLPAGRYVRLFENGPDNPDLFAGVYD